MTDRLKIGQEVLIHGYIDEIRKDTVIIRNEGGYFGTVQEEILVKLQEPKTGHWIEINMAGRSWAYGYNCSKCNQYMGIKTNYCPNCGCRMVEPQERSEDAT